MKTPVKTSFAALLICVLPAFFISCTSDDDKTVGPVPPNHATIAFEEPTADTIITGGEPLPIMGSISSLKGIQGYKIVVRRKSDQAELMVKSFADTDTLVGFNQSWVNDLSAAADMEVEVVANLDATGSTASEKINFQATP